MTNESMTIGSNQTHRISITCQPEKQEEVEQNGHSFKCIGNSKVCCLGVLSLFAIAGGLVILADDTPEAIDNYHREQYWEMTKSLICDLAGACLIIGGGWKAKKIFYELRAANQMYPAGRFPP